MASINAITGVGVAGMSWTLRVAEATAAAAHPAFAAPVARAAAVIVPQRKRRAATAIIESVDRGTV
jgi:hypothetical protein